MQFLAQHPDFSLATKKVGGFSTPNGVMSKTCFITHPVRTSASLILCFINKPWAESRSYPATPPLKSGKLSEDYIRGWFKNQA